MRFISKSGLAIVFAVTGAIAQSRSGATTGGGMGGSQRGPQQPNQCNRPTPQQRGGPWSSRFQPPVFYALYPPQLPDYPAGNSPAPGDIYPNASENNSYPPAFPPPPVPAPFIQQPQFPMPGINPALNDNSSLKVYEGLAAPDVDSNHPPMLVLRDGSAYTICQYRIKGTIFEAVTTQGERLRVPAASVQRIYGGERHISCPGR